MATQKAPKIRKNLPVKSQDTPQAAAQQISQPLIAQQQAGISNLAMQSQLLGQHKPNYQISHPNDANEQQARRNADQIMQMPPNNTLLAPSTPQKSLHHSGNADALPGSGRPLPTSLKNFYEPRLGSDLSHVRIHDDASTHNTAKSLNARAFTQNNHIGFHKGQFNPHTNEGKHLLAHELTHVMQPTEHNAIHCETWDVNDNRKEITRGVLVQLIFTNTWSDWYNNTGWTNARKTSFRSNFVSSIENSFNNSNTVINPHPSQADVLPNDAMEQGYKPLVDIDLVADGETSVSEDWEVDVESNPGRGYRQSSSSTSYGYLHEGSNDSFTKRSSGPGVTQIPTVHEFGHFIGLDHPGEGLEGGLLSDSELSPGASEYGHTGQDQHGRNVDGPNDLMGGGMGLRNFYFDDWAEALNEHVEALRRAEQQRQFQQDMRMFERSFTNDPEAGEWLRRGFGGY